MSYKSLLKISIICLLGLFALNCSKSAKKEAKEDGNKSELEGKITLTEKEAATIGIVAEEVKLLPFAGELTISAKVIADQDGEALVGSLISGRVARVFAKMGDFVSAGQTLMLIEGVEIGQIKATYLTAKAKLEFAKNALDRQSNLISQNAGSQKALAEAKAEYQRAQAEFIAEDKKIHSIGLQESDLQLYSDEKTETHTAGAIPIKSPISGVVVERNVVVGQAVGGDANAFKIINLSKIWVDGQLHENDIDKVEQNSEVTFTTSSDSEIKFVGKLTYTGQVIDEKTRTITARAEFANSNLKLKPSMFGELKIPAKKGTSSLFINAESVVVIEGVNYVFVSVDKQNFIKRKVVTGATKENLFEIKSGLYAGEKVVVKGAYSIKSVLLKSAIEGD